MRQLAFLCSALTLLVGGSHALADGKNPNYTDDVAPMFRQLPRFTQQI